MYKKVVTPTNTTEEHYLMDAFGKTLAIENMKVSTDKWEYFVVTNERDVRLKPSDNSVQFNYGEATFFLYDHLGNTRVSYSKLDNGLMVHSLTDYFPYGKILREYVSTRPRYLTTQHERDTETDLDYRGARYYDSEYGRFLSVDPEAAKVPGWSTYRYCFDNPVKYVDPTGRYEAIGSLSKGEEAEIRKRHKESGNEDWEKNAQEEINGRVAENVKIIEEKVNAARELLESNPIALEAFEQMTGTKQGDANYLNFFVNNGKGGGSNL